MLDKNRQKNYIFYMKKFFIWALPVLTILAVASVFVLSFISSTNKSSVYATRFSYNYENITLFVNNTYTLNSTEFTIEPSNCTEKIVYATDDSNILDINNSTGEIFAKATGTCTLTAYIKSSATENLSVSIDVAVIEQNEDSPYKTEIEVNYTFNINDEVEYIEFDTGSKKDKNTVNVITGNENIDIISIDDHRITFSLLSTGTACIEINSPTKKITINIQII